MPTYPSGVYNQAMHLQTVSQKIIYSDLQNRIAHFCPCSTDEGASRESAPADQPDTPEQDLPESRELRDEEIRLLREQGNSAEDWSAVRVHPDFNVLSVRGNQFFGRVYLGVFSGAMHAYPVPGGVVSLPQGVYGSTLADCRIGSASAVHRCPMLQGVRTGREVLLSNSSLRSSGATIYGNGIEIPIGVEIGGRPVRIFADLSLELAQFVLDRPGDALVQDDFNALVDRYCSRIQGHCTIVDDYAAVLDARHIQDAYIGPHAWVHQCDCIEEATILSTPADPTEVGPSSVIRRSIIQEGVSVDTGALVFDSMLFEHSYVTEHGKVQHTIVGPNSGVSLGEATASFMGPFVGFHHQSLLIANYWPGGRGNIGYGANVGSNHTSRMPDQECWPGEGMFFGLSSVIKYPANYREAPYTIIAAGVTTLPQKISFPFSLINEPVAYYLEVPPGFNNLIPAWGLTDNLYSLKRNEGKYKARNKAKRNHFDLTLFRPEIIAYMRKAVEYLESITERKTIYLPKDIPGLGKNMMTDVNRLKAIEAYRFFITLASLKAMRDRILANPKAVRSAEERRAETAGLERYLTMVPELLTRTLSSRQRDIDRGKAIIDDYQQTHCPAEEDPFVVETRQEVELELSRTRQALEYLSGA